MLGIGIDFGTSNSSAALFDGDRLLYVELEPGAADAAVMPTALYLRRTLAAEVGRAAVDAYMRDNAGRSVTLTREHVGAIEIVVAGTDVTRGAADGSIIDVAKVHAFTDRDLPGRLFRSLKRWLGDPGLDQVSVYDRPYRIVALVTPILVAIRRGLTLDTAGGVRTLRAGRPVHFEGRDPRANEVATARLRESYRHAGLEPLEFFPEPAAAALSYLHGRELRSELLLAFDFGGGTLDLCILRRDAGRFEILTTAGISLGGDAIDALIYRHKVFPELGQGALVASDLVTGPRKVPFNFLPFGDRLLNWSLSYELNRPDLLEPVAQGAREKGEAGRRVQRLHDLITGNHSYRVFQAIERAKIELSSHQAATIEVPEIDLLVPVERGEFEALLEEPLVRIKALVRQTLEGAGLRPEQIGAVVRTGGSSQIPAVEALLSAIFPGKVVEHDPFRSIAAGLAIAGFLGLEH